jgi:hypothetical protein
MNLADIAVKEAGLDNIYLAVDPYIAKGTQSLITFLQSHNSFPLFHNTLLNNYLSQSSHIMKFDKTKPFISPIQDINGVDISVFFISSLKYYEIINYIQSILFKIRYDDNYLLLRIYDPFALNSFGIMFSAEEREAFFRHIKKVIYTSSDRRMRILSKKEAGNEKNYIQ